MVSAGPAEVRGGGAAGEAGDSSGRVWLQLQRGPEAAGVSRQSHPEEEPHPHHRRGHGQRGSQVLQKPEHPPHIHTHRSEPVSKVLLSLQDRRADPENHPGQVQ